MRSAPAIGVTLALAAGCGEGPTVVERSPSATPRYEGPLEPAAAVSALECDARTPYRKGRSAYDDGLARVKASAGEALAEYMTESGPIGAVPSRGYVVERETGGRVLFSYDVEGRTKVAMLAADDVRDWDDDEGWGVRAWAQCDPAELPAAVTDDLNIGVWEDASGRRVSIDRIRSFQGAEHCGWTDITFLLIGPERRADWYVRDTDDDFHTFLRTSFSYNAALPAGATDTGLLRKGQELWLDEGRAAYLVDLEDPDDVERWPAATQAVGCA
jgi:hypothetical protein